MMVVDGERYCNAKEAANYLGINRCMFYNNVQERIKRYQIGARKRKMYKVAELDMFIGIQQVKSQDP